MPRMDGAALAEHIRVARPELPLVVVSGHPLEMVTRGGGGALRGRQPRVS